MKQTAVHLSSVPCLDLAEWSAVLRGSDAVISRYVHRNESLREEELEALFNSRPEDSRLLKVINADQEVGKKQTPT